jgi:hypothetical protein
MARLVLCCAIALVGCYEPKLPECAVECSADADCAPDQMCRSDGWCVTTDFTESCVAPLPGVVVDASVDGTPVMSDAPASPDAPPPLACAPGCGGSCENGVCVIRCADANSCGGQVFCPATGPCRVECAGEKSCRNGVRCGFGRCTVLCTGEESCKKRVHCEASCACDVTCGDDACDGDSTCPLHPWCEAGDGCSSAPAGCNAC